MEPACDLLSVKMQREKIHYCHYTNILKIFSCRCKNKYPLSKNIPFRTVKKRNVDRKENQSGLVDIRLLISVFNAQQQYRIDINTIHFFNEILTSSHTHHILGHNSLANRNVSILVLVKFVFLLLLFNFLLLILFLLHIESFF